MTVPLPRGAAVAVLKPLPRALVVLAHGLAVSACDRGMGDLRQYIEEVKQRKSGYVEPIPQMKPYERYVYVPDGRRSPFQSARPESGQSAAHPRSTAPPPDRGRNPEPLEQYPLDSLKYVGTIRKNGTTWALVRDSEGVIHRVQEGNYMGQNYGRIVAITGQEIRLVEKVPNGFGGWKDRSETLPLNE